MRLVTKKEDADRDREIKHLHELIASLRVEVLQLREQSDNMREIPPIFMPGDQPARVTIMNDARMARQQRGEKLDED
jgi:hypothetical protein